MYIGWKIHVEQKKTEQKVEFLSSYPPIPVPKVYLHQLLLVILPEFPPCVHNIIFLPLLLHIYMLIEYIHRGAMRSNCLCTRSLFLMEGLWGGVGGPCGLTGVRAL